MRCFHDLKDSAFGAFKSYKLELKGEGKARDWFSLLRFYILPK